MNKTLEQFFTPTKLSIKKHRSDAQIRKQGLRNYVPEFMKFTHNLMFEPNKLVDTKF